jgi:hypothetical protein
MNRTFYASLLFGITLVLFSCSEKTTPNTTSESTEETTPPVVEQMTVSGKFRSVSGVMDKLSCYCSHGGYVTSEGGTVTDVCFDEEVESCDKITVTGYMTSRSIEANGACSGGIMGFLKAQSYIVGETDY